MTEIAPSPLRYTSAPGRRAQLYQLVQEQGYCTTAELSKALDVSEMTIRRDVAKLVAEGLLRSVHGGVSALSASDLAGRRYEARADALSGVKEAIAARAVSEMPESGVIGIDAGTTAASLARQLPSDRPLRVVTPSLPVITQLATSPTVELTALGGVLHGDSLSFAGQLTLDAIGSLRIDVFFLTASALSSRGAFCANDFDALTKRALIEATDRVVLLSDSSKFRTQAMVKICDWPKVDSLIVDDGIDDDARRALADQNVEVIAVPVEAGS